MAAAAPGSHLALSHTCPDQVPRYQMERATQVYQAATANVHPRTRAQTGRFFDGLAIVPPYPGAVPGLTHVGMRGAEDVDAADSDGSRAFFCAVARKP